MIKRIVSQGFYYQTKESYLELIEKRGNYWRTIYWYSELLRQKRVLMGNCFHTKNYIECPNRAAQTSMKAAHENNISLEDAVYADTSDSAILDAK